MGGESAPLTLREILEILELEPLPGEGGYFRQTWAAPDIGIGRPAATTIYFLLTRETQGFSALHVLDAPETYHHYTGGTVELWTFDPVELKTDRRILGSDLRAGERPQAMVPAGIVQGSRLLSGEWALVGTTMTPGYRPEGFRLSNPIELEALFPEQRDTIRSLTRTET